MIDINKIEFDDIPSQFLIHWQKLSVIEWQLKFLDKSEKSILAKLATNSWWKSEAERNRLAYQDKEYTEWLEWMKQATRERLELRYICNALEMKFEYCRSVNSLNKAKSQLY